MTAREIVYRVLVEVEKGAFANLVLDDFLKNSLLSGKDRALATEIIYGTVKNRSKLDWIIDNLAKNISKLDIKVRVILRMALYQIVFLEKVPASAATNEAVKLAKKMFHQGVAGLVNGILRNYLRNPRQISWPKAAENPVEYLEKNYSHPAWMLKRWLKRYGFSAVEEMCRFNNEPAAMWVRTNTLRHSREALEARLEMEGCRTQRSWRVPEGLLLIDAPPLYRMKSFQDGLFTVQDESSMLVSHFLRPHPGQVVLDVCAGPGGKTTHLAQLMENSGSILACDVHEHRLKLIEENAQRLGIKIIKTLLKDATKMENQDQSYELILVDAPCSGLGVLRRRPDSRWRKSEEDINTLAALQVNILENALKLLKTGGRLIYSTCTIEPEENYGVIEQVKRNNPTIRSLDLIPFAPYQPVSEEEKAELQTGTRQYLPFKDKMEGFFIAGLEKV